MQTIGADDDLRRKLPAIGKLHLGGGSGHNLGHLHAQVDLNALRSGRIRKGPAPLNLEIPPYKFTGDANLLVG